MSIDKHVFWSITCVLALAAGCTGNMAVDPGGRSDTGRPGPDGTPPGDPGPGDPAASAGWTLKVDTSMTDSYVPIETEQGTLRGQIASSLGVERLEVGPTDSARSIEVGAAGDFTTQVPVPIGLSLAEVRAYDNGEHSARGNRSFLRSSFLPDGQMNSGAVAITVSDGVLSALAGSALGGLGDISLASFLAPGSPLIEDGTCRLYVDNVSHDPITVELGATDDGRLRAVGRVSNITVGFSGSCNLGGTAIGVRRGSEADETTAELRMVLEANPPAPGECVRGFRASEVSVAITSFDIDLRLEGCGLLCLFGELIGEIAEGSIRGMLEERFGSMVGGLIDPLLADLEILNVDTSLDFLGAPVNVGLCMTGLGPEDGQLVARLGARVSGPGGGPRAPGAPLIPATLPPRNPGKLWLDAGLVGQILYGVWSGGGLQIEDATSAFGGDGGGSPIPLNVGALTLLVPQLREAMGPWGLTEDSPLQIDIDAQIAPLVRASTPGEEDAAAGVDMYIELGNLAINLRSGTQQLFVLHTHIRLALALEANAEGALQPVIVEDATESTTWLVDTAVESLPGPVADRLAGLVDGLIAGQLSPLLEGAAIALPDLGVPLVIEDITPTDGGYLEVTLGGELGAGAPPAM